MCVEPLLVKQNWVQVNSLLTQNPALAAMQSTLLERQRLYAKDPALLQGIVGDCQRTERVISHDAIIIIRSELCDSNLG